MKNIKKRVMQVLSVLILCTMLFSCGIVNEFDLYEEYPEKSTFSTTSLEINVPDVPSADKSESPTAYNSEIQLSYLPTYNCEGNYFIILTMENNGNLFPDQNDYISASAYTRNNLVQEKYNVQLLEKKMSPEALSEYVESSELAGSYYADLVCLPTDKVGLFYEKKLIDDFTKKPYYVDNRPYFNSGITQKLNEGYDGVYALFCETLIRPDDLYCVFYNKAHEGASSVATYTADFSENSFIELANSHKTVANEKFSRFGDILERVTHEEKDAMEIFLDGGALFYVDKLSVLPELSSKTPDLGLLALPKNENGEFYSRCELDDLYVFCYPSNTTVNERTMLIMMGLGAAGCDYNMQTAREHYIEYVQDNSSAIMLEKILSKYGLDD